MRLTVSLKLFFASYLLGALPASRLVAQNLTLEGQTGGFLTPTAYVVYADKGQSFSHPAIGFHFIDASAVIGNIETFSITESFAGRAEAGYTRSVHQFGDQPTTTATPLGLSNLWNYSGMNVFHGKVVAFKDGQFGPWMPGIAIGGVVRTGDHFVSGAANKTLTGTDKSYTNGDAYVAVTKTWAKKPVPFLAQPRLEGHQCHDLRHRRPEHSLRRTVLRRSGHSAAPRPWHRGRALGGIHAGAQDFGESEHPAECGALSVRGFARLQSCVVPADERPYTHDAGLRRARDAEGQAALRV